MPGSPRPQSALRRLREARDRLEEAQGERMRRDLDDARDRVEELARRQEEVEQRMAALREAGRPSQDDVGEIRDTKTEMAEEVGDLLAGLDRLAAGARRDGAEGAEELDEATETIRETQLRERLLYSRGLVGRAGQEEYAEAFENQTAQAIQSLRNRLEEASEAGRGRCCVRLRDRGPGVRAGPGAKPRVDRAPGPERRPRGRRRRVPGEGTSTRAIPSGRAPAVPRSSTPNRSGRCAARSASGWATRRPWPA